MLRFPLNQGLPLIEPTFTILSKKVYSPKKRTLFGAPDQAV